MEIPLLMYAPSWPGFPRCEWAAHDGDAMPISTYKVVGAQVMDEWKVCRLSGAALAGFARTGAGS